MSLHVITHHQLNQQSFYSETACQHGTRYHDQRPRQLAVSFCHSRRAKVPFTRYNLLSNRFDNRLYRVYKHSTGCQTRLTTGCIVYRVGYQTGCTIQFDNRSNEQWLFVPPGLTTGWMFVYTIQPVVKQVVEPVVSCKRGIRKPLALATAWLCDRREHTRHETDPNIVASRETARECICPRIIKDSINQQRRSRRLQLLQTATRLILSVLTTTDINSQPRHLQPDSSTVTTLFQEWFSMTFPWPKKWISMTYRHSIFFRKNDTRFMNAYQNKNIFPVAHQSVSK